MAANASNDAGQWCARRDSNPQAVRHWLLRPACIPFHHPRRRFDFHPNQGDISPPEVADRSDSSTADVRVVFGDLRSRRQTDGFVHQSSIGSSKRANSANLSLTRESLQKPLATMVAAVRVT